MQVDRAKSVWDTHLGAVEALYQTQLGKFRQCGEDFKEL